jgi:hypothetical protein
MFEALFQPMHCSLSSSYWWACFSFVECFGVLFQG